MNGRCDSPSVRGHLSLYWRLYCLQNRFQSNRCWDSRSRCSLCSRAGRQCTWEATSTRCEMKDGTPSAVTCWDLWTSHRNWKNRHWTGWLLLLDMDFFLGPILAELTSFMFTLSPLFATPTKWSIKWNNFGQVVKAEYTRAVAAVIWFVRQENVAIGANRNFLAMPFLGSRLHCPTWVQIIEVNIIVQTKF